jgi:hypothetical protein
MPLLLGISFEMPAQEGIKQTADVMTERSFYLTECWTSGCSVETETSMMLLSCPLARGKKFPSQIPYTVSNAFV